VGPGDGVDYDQVATEQFPSAPPSTVREVLVCGRMLTTTQTAEILVVAPRVRQAPHRCHRVLQG
jgi:hypothetical protein